MGLLFAKLWSLFSTEGAGRAFLFMLHRIGCAVAYNLGWD